MAKDKNSFIAYCNWMSVFDELEDDEAGRLAKHLFRYVNDLQIEPPDKLTKIAFIPIQTVLKTDLKKWETYQDKQKANGLKGGRPTKSETQITQAFIPDSKKPTASTALDESVVESKVLFNFKDAVIELGVEKQITSDWLKVRKTKKGSNTETAFNKIKNEITKTNLTANECIKLAVEKSWCGFESEWVINNLKNGESKRDNSTVKATNPNDTSIYCQH